MRISIVTHKPGPIEKLTESFRPPDTVKGPLYTWRNVVQSTIVAITTSMLNEDDVTHIFVERSDAST